MQQWHEEEKKLQAYLKEVAEACCIKQAMQKTRKVTEAKV